MKCEARAKLYGTTVIVESIDDSRCIYKLGFYGQPLGVEKPKGADFSSPIRLTHLEALYLVERGILTVVDGNNEVLDFQKLWSIFEKHNPQLKTQYQIYKSLRNNGLIVRAG